MNLPQTSAQRAYMRLMCRVFGPGLLFSVKPRIRKADAWHWVSVGGGIVAYGLSPGMAYEMWRRGRAGAKQTVTETTA